MKSHIAFALFKQVNVIWKQTLTANQQSQNSAAEIFYTQICGNICVTVKGRCIFLHKVQETMKALLDQICSCFSLIDDRQAYYIFTVSEQLTDWTSALFMERYCVNFFSGKKRC